MPDQTSTYGLLARVREGDEEAFTQLFRKTSPRLAVLIHSKMSTEMRGRIEVDDLLQETFVAAYRSLGRFDYRNPGSFMSWLARIADHVIVDAARHHGRRKRRPVELVPLGSNDGYGAHEAADSVTPSRILVRKEKIQRVQDALNRLPEDYRRVILLSRIQGLPMQEVAECMGRSRESTAVLLHRAVRRLKQVDDMSGA